MVPPNLHPKNDHLLGGKPHGCWGVTTILGNPHIDANLIDTYTNLTNLTSRTSTFLLPPSPKVFLGAMAFSSKLRASEVTRGTAERTKNRRQ